MTSSRKRPHYPQAIQPSPEPMPLPEMETAAEEIRRKYSRRGRSANILAGRLLETSRGRQLLGF